MPSTGSPCECDDERVATERQERPDGLACHALTLEQQWFRQFFIGILLCVNNGACFTFGIFSPFLKRGGFGYDQSQVNIVSSVGVLLSYFSMPNGYLYDRKGPRATLLVGSLLNMSGWAGMFALFLNVDEPLLGSSVAVMCFFYGLAQFSASFYETGSVLTNLRAFSCYKGRVVLIQKTFMGLGSSIVAQLYVAFFERSFATVAPFFLFLFALSALVGVLSGWYVQLPGERTWCLGLNVPDLATLARGGGESTMFDRPFNLGTGILCLAVGFVLAASMIENFVPELSAALRAAIGVVTLGLVASFASIIAVTPSYAVNLGGFHESAKDASRRAALLHHNSVLAGPTGAAVAARSSGCHAEKAILGGRPLSTAMMTESPRAAAIHRAVAGVVEGKEREAAEGEKLEAHLPSGWCDAPHTASLARSYGCCRDSSPPTAVTTATVCAVAGTDPVLQRVDSASSPLRAWTRWLLGGAMAPPPVALNEAELTRNLRHRELWLLWYICFASWGAMTLVSSNSSQIYQAVAYSSFTLTVNTVFVSLYGVASAVGRIVVGSAQPLMERHGVPVSVFLVVAPVLNLVGLPLFLAVPPTGLFLPFLIVGFATGVSWGSTVLIITAFFTTLNCGKHYSFLYTAGMLSPLVFNLGLFGPLYDRHSHLQGHDDDHSCDGVACIATSVLVCLAVNLAAVPCAFYFVRRTMQRGGVLV